MAVAFIWLALIALQAKAVGAWGGDDTNLKKALATRKGNIRMQLICRA